MSASCRLLSVFTSIKYNQLDSLLRFIDSLLRFIVNDKIVKGSLMGHNFVPKTMENNGNFEKLW